MAPATVRLPWCRAPSTALSSVDKTILKGKREMASDAGFAVGPTSMGTTRAEGDALGSVIGCGLAASGPWQKTGVEVTELELSFGRVVLAPAFNFGGKEIVVCSVSPPAPARRGALAMLVAARLESTSLVLCSEMGLQCRRASYVSNLRGVFVKSTSHWGRPHR